MQICFADFAVSEQVSIGLLSEKSCLLRPNPCLGPQEFQKAGLHGPHSRMVYMALQHLHGRFCFILTVCGIFLYLEDLLGWGLLHG